MIGTGHNDRSRPRRSGVLTNRVHRSRHGTRRASGASDDAERPCGAGHGTEQEETTWHLLRDPGRTAVCRSSNAHRSGDEAHLDRCARRTVNTKNTLREGFTRPVCTVVRCQESFKSGGSWGRWVYFNLRLPRGARWVHLPNHETPTRRGACDRPELHPLGWRHQRLPMVPSIGTADDQARSASAVTPKGIATRGARTKDVVQRVDPAGDRPRGPRWLSSPFREPQSDAQASTEGQDAKE
jgi:hypothetical protein